MRDLHSHRYNLEGFTIIGVDEAGRGPLAGPVIAAAVIIQPLDTTHLHVPSDSLYIEDSKSLSHLQREKSYDYICRNAVSFGIGLSSPLIIDQINILQASLRAMRIAVEKIQKKMAIDSSRCIVLVDGNQKIPGLNLPQETIVKGDQNCYSVAAASIVAKVVRDRLMKTYSRIYAQYDFDKHKGYGTAKHLALIRQWGPSPIHRQTFRGVILHDASE